MLTRHLTTTKTIEICLDEEKFYFPGETIKGFVIVHPKTSIKVNSIVLKFFGQVYIHLKEKETIQLFQRTNTLSVYPNNNESNGNHNNNNNRNSSVITTTSTTTAITLDSVEHKFKFSFEIPKDLDLPSSMELNKKGHIRYTISALLDRPMIPESLCPKCEYNVSILEYIDIGKDQFKAPQEKSLDIMLPRAKYNQKCMVKAYIPRLGFTKGDIIPLKVTVHHFTSFSRRNGVTVDLTRTVEIRTNRHTTFKENILKSNTYDIDVHEPTCVQEMICQTAIPTSTPPSIRYKDKVLRFHYKIRVTVVFSSATKNPYVLDIPIVIGTWPRAAIPIDDDEPEGENSLSDPEDDIVSLRTCSIDEPRTISSSSSSLGIWRGTSNSSSTIITTTPKRNSVISNNSIVSSDVGRSDSIASNTSFNSVSSWKSNRSYEQRNSGLVRNTSQSTTVSSPDRLPSWPTYNAHAATGIVATSVAHPQHRYSTQEYSLRNSNSTAPFYNTNNSSFQQRQSVILNGSVNVSGDCSGVNFNRMSRYSNSTIRLKDEATDAPAAILQHNTVPTHVLEPITVTSIPSQPLKEIHSNSSMNRNSDNSVASTAVATPTCTSDSSSISSEDDDDDDDDSDEDDLLAIIEKKKKRERRELRKEKKARRAEKEA